MIEFNPDKHEYRVDGVLMPSVTDILDTLTAKHYGGINPAVLQAAAVRGTMVHERLEEIDYGFFDGMVEYEISGYCKAYLSFLRTYKVDWRGIEQIVYEPILGYCGTVDRWGDIDGERCVVDFKTYTQPTRENYLSLMGQTAAYTYALIAQDGIAESYRKVKKYGLFLRKDGTFRLVDCAEYEEKYKVTGSEIFSRCLEFYKWKERLKNDGKRKRNSGI